MTRLPKSLKGPIAWMAANPVAANLSMVILIFGGLILAQGVKQEVMPEFQLDVVTVSVPYPGASPAEVEQGILLAIEEQVRSLDSIKKVTSVASEGMGSVRIELVEGSDGNKSLQDIKNGVDRITSFPQDSERPVVQLITNRREVISLVLYGDFEEDILRGLAEQVREELLNSDQITTVEMNGVRPIELSIEVPQENLRAYNLTLDQVAAAVRRTSVELPAGGVKTRGGEILLRTDERRDYGLEFADIPVITRADGTQVLLKDVANIVDGFRETDQAAFYNGKPAVQIRVFRVGKQKPIDIAEEVKAYAADLDTRLPEGVGVATWYDASEMYADRVDLLTRNAGLGLLLVLIVLGLFLEIRLAFWVTMGIPISILGAFLIIPNVGVSINMISLFAFIITLGIVVDDAVVVGENIFEMREEGYSRLEAAIRGAKGVAIPVTFAVLTNIVAFAPMLFVPGVSGKFFKVIPLITIAVFLVSLFESLFILPAHLSHSKPTPEHGFRGLLRRGQKRFSGGLDKLIRKAYQPVLIAAVRNRYLVVAVGIAVLMLTVGFVGSGAIKFSFLPKIEQDLITVNARLAFGSPAQDSRDVAAKLEAAMREVVAENGGDDILRGVLVQVGAGMASVGGPPAGGGVGSGSHLAGVSVYLVPSDDRPVSTTEFTRQWRARLNDLAGLESLTFNYSTGPSSGPAVTIQLIHQDMYILEQASGELALEIGNYGGVKDLNDGFTPGKPQFDFKVKPEARTLGITSADLGAQLRNAFYGARAFRQQRGREEIWIMVRLPEEERKSEYHINKLLIRTPMGGEIPLHEAAVLERGRAYTEITRTDGKRQVSVTADVNEAEANANEIVSDVLANVVPGLLAKYPGLSYSLEGEQRDQQESLASLGKGFMIAMMVVFALLAIPFRSYVQPLVVMSAIPFGFTGAVIGHYIMGFNLSLISLMGIVALAGVVVNDSLVMVHRANENRKDMSPRRAIISAGMRRFRPILLTSLTTFFGLAPMMFETSMQARFLIPMALSLGFGILFSTLIILLLVPSLYMIVNDLVRLYSKKPEDYEEPEAA
ncbi:MAG: efflux RND transporter permease subunit [Acidobacteriota bacterium]|nr:efflux RND transporter permease subunit [Acidobacteriota bacterium]